MTEQDFIIPVDEPIREFLGHLDANPRTILSSKFGDGKSYFLDALVKNDCARKEYEFLTLYPVNYQVVENRDIFELIKADLLFQLFIHGMFSNRVTVKKDVALSFFIRENHLSLASKLIPYIAEVALAPEEARAVILAMKGARLFKDLKEKFVHFCEEYDDDTYLEKFMEQVDNTFLYESDIVSYLIRKAISDYKGRTNKKVVLVIEDLDRLDPAHLFRILNVFSAHMDMSYRYGVKPDKSLVGNKFELDNVVMVIDYSNMRRIFHHFYGEDTDFSGYISKFTSSAPFFYSLTETRQQYIKQEIVRITDAPENLVDLLIPMDEFEEKTIRDVVHAFDISKQFKKRPVYSYQGGKVSLDDTLLKLMAIMQRLRMPEADIQRACLLIYQKSREDFFTYVSPYAFLMKQSDPTGLNAKLFLSDERGHYHQSDIIMDAKTGRCQSGSTYMNFSDKGTNLLELGKLMFSFIRK